MGVNDEEEFFEISAERDSFAEDPLLDTRQGKRRRRRYEKGRREQKNVIKRKVVLSPQLLFIKRFVLWGGVGICLTGMFLFFSLPLLEARRERQEKMAQHKPPFRLNTVDGLQAAEAFLALRDRDQIASACVQSPTLKKALDQYLPLLTQKEISLKMDAEPVLKEEYFPQVIEVQTDRENIPLYIREEEQSHRVDLEASIGYNPITIDDLNTFSVTQVENLRVFLKLLPPLSGEIYGRVEGVFPQEAGRIVFYFKKESELATALEYQLRRKGVVQATVNLSLNDLLEPQRYFISSLTAFHWVF